MKNDNRMLHLLIAAVFTATVAVSGLSQVPVTVTGSVNDLGEAKDIIGGITDEADGAMAEFDADPEEKPVEVVDAETVPEESSVIEVTDVEAIPEEESDAEGEAVADVTASEDAIPDGDARISVKFDNEPFANAVKLLMELSGANIIAPRASTNDLSVTANLQNVPWREAAEAILAGNNYAIREVTPGSDIWVIEAIKPGTPAPWVTETFKLQYIKASDAMRMLQSMLGIAVDDKSKAPAKRTVTKKTEDDVEKEDVEVIFREDGRLASVPESNMMIVSAPAKKVDEIRKVLLSVDVPRMQVFVEAKIVQIQGNASRNIGFDWSALDGALGIGVGPFSKSYQRAKTTTKEGLSGFTSSSSFRNGALSSLSSSSSSEGGTGIEKETTIKDIRTLALNFAEMEAVLQLLEANDDAKLVSNPKMIVANEEAAVIDMSRKEPYVSVEKQQDGTGSDVTYTWTTELEVIPGDNEDLPYIEQAFFSYGIRLKVVPRVNNESNITVVIEPTISKLHEYYTPGDEGLTRYPIIDSKRVKTTFSLSDGGTAVIGGLTETEDSDIEKKVPFLGDIPFIGKWLFTNKKTEKIRKETIIFVTIGIVDEATHPGRGLLMPEATKLIYDHVNDDGTLKSDIDVERSKWASAKKEEKDKKEKIAADKAADKAAKEAAIIKGEALIPMDDKTADAMSEEPVAEGEEDKLRQLQMGEILEPMQ